MYGYNRLVHRILWCMDAAQLARQIADGASLLWEDLTEREQASQLGVVFEAAQEASEAVAESLEGDPEPDEKDLAYALEAQRAYGSVWSQLGRKGRRSERGQALLGLYEDSGPLVRALG